MSLPAGFRLYRGVVGGVVGDWVQPKKAIALPWGKQVKPTAVRVTPADRK
ncbi:MAG: hypothetical protein KFF72_14685 [Arthrospira sp. SH-MAG29]|nr:hypothetical protein [Arthrospira sp. SH-MAG29]MBS0017572.1 hypothetical protein [Arthrospira sp. SH-MAG29]